MTEPRPLVEDEASGGKALNTDLFTGDLVVTIKNHRFNDKVYEGNFKFKRLNLWGDTTVDNRRAAGANGLDWFSHPGDSRDRISAMATLSEALVDVPEWYNAPPKTSPVTKELVVTLYLEYRKWVSLSFQGVPSDGDGAGGEQGLVVNSCVRDLERRLAGERGPAGGAD